MMVKHGLETGLSQDGTGHGFGASREGFPFSQAKTIGAVIRPARWVRSGTVPLLSARTRNGEGEEATADSSRAILTALAMPPARAEESFSATGTNAPSMTKPRLVNSTRNAGGAVGR